MITIVLDSDSYSPEALKFYKSLGRVWLWDKLKKNEQAKAIAKVDIIVTRLVKIDKKMIDDAPSLKIIASNTTGLNHIDVDYAKKKKVKVISLRGKTGFLRKITATAELTIGLMLALVRNIPRAFDSVKSGQWDRNTFRGHQLADKTFGILGYGRLGKIVGRYAKVLGMKVIAHDPKIHRGVKAVSMKDLFKQPDILSIHVLLTNKTKNLVKLEHLKLMKPTAYLVNTARGEIIKKRALVSALKKRYIKGAAIDVMWNEVSDGSHLKKDPLWQYAKKHQNLLIVPHIGGAAYEAMQITEEFVAGLVKDYVGNKLQ